MTLTNFLTTYVTDDTQYRNKLVTYREIALHYNVHTDSKLGELLLENEERLFLNCWEELGYIPKGFDSSCLYSKAEYVSLSQLSKYPTVRMLDLFELADAFSLVILPIELVDIDKVIGRYAVGNAEYAREVLEAYKKFREVVVSCKATKEQQIFMLAPLPFYSPEAYILNGKPAIFPNRYFKINDFQKYHYWKLRKKYETIKSKPDSMEMKAFLRNFDSIYSVMQNCFADTFWVQEICKHLGKVILPDDFKKLPFNDWVYFAFTPIIFSVNALPPHSSLGADAFAHIGLCFGKDLPNKVLCIEAVKEFLGIELTEVNDSNFEEVSNII